MTNRRTAILVLSLLIGAVAAFFTYVYVNSAQSRAYNGAHLVRVFVVSKDIDKDVGGDEAVAKGMIKSDSIPQKYCPGSAITDTQVVKGKVALAKLSPGQVIVDGMFVDPRVAQVTAAKRIPAGQVAVTVQVDPVKGVAGLIVPGDKVNIMAPTADGGEATLYSNVEVLYIGATAAPEAGSTAAVTNPGSNLVTFAVPEVAAQRIVLAARTDPGIHLTLVPPDDKPAKVPPVNAGNLFSGGTTPYEN